MFFFAFCQLYCMYLLLWTSTTPTTLPLNGHFFQPVIVYNIFHACLPFMVHYPIYLFYYFQEDVKTYLRLAFAMPKLLSSRFLLSLYPDNVPTLVWRVFQSNLFSTSEHFCILVMFLPVQRLFNLDPSMLSIDMLPVWHCSYYGSCSASKLSSSYVDLIIFISSYCDNIQFTQEMKTHMLKRKQFLITQAKKTFLFV